MTDLLAANLPELLVQAGVALLAVAVLGLLGTPDRTQPLPRSSVRPAP